VRALREANADNKVSDAAGEIYAAAVWSEADDDELDAGASADHLWEPLVVNGPAVVSKDWRPDIKFDDSKCGPQGVASGLSKAQIFAKFLPDEDIKIMVVYTNNYAHQVQRSGWIDTYLSEMKAFLGALLYMGRKKLLRPDAWRIDPWGDVFLKTVFRERRFTDILACFHMVTLITLITLITL